MSLKKILALIAAVVMVLTATVVFAETVETDESVPPILVGPEFKEEVTEEMVVPSGVIGSITSYDLIDVVVNIEETDFMLFFIKEPTAWASWYQPELDAITNYVAAGNSVVSYFPAEIQNEVMAHFAEGTDKDSLVCYEIEAPDCKNYKPEYGDIGATGIYPTDYTDTTAVAVIGFCDGVREDGTNIMRWAVMDSQVNENGTVNLTFQKDSMVRMQDKDHAILVTISTPIAQPEE